MKLLFFATFICLSLSQYQSDQSDTYYPHYPYYQYDYTDNTDNTDNNEQSSQDSVYVGLRNELILIGVYIIIVMTCTVCAIIASCKMDNRKMTFNVPYFSNSYPSKYNMYEI
jgi:hypothetical protein